jgi:hypothetical protein
MPMAPLLQRFVDDELARAPGVAERTLAGSLQLLRDSKDSALGPSERLHHFALVEALQRHAVDYRAAFVEGLQARVLEALAEQGDGSGRAALPNVGALELMDESRVEIDIEISRAMQRIDTTAEWELRELQTFTSTLIGQAHVSAESNPFRAAAYANALWQAACAVTGVQDERTTLLRISAGVTAGVLKNAWAAACTRLESQGVAPGIYRTILLAPGATPERGPSPLDASQPGAMASMLARMPSGAGELRLGVGKALGASPGDGARRRAGVEASNAEFDQALARLDELLRHLSVPGAGSGATAGAAGESAADALTRGVIAQRAALVASVHSPVDRQVIELLALVFDAMLTDAQLHASFAGIVARLQASALRVALHDAAMMESKQHSVWQLLDRIGEAACSHPLPGDPRSAQALQYCQMLADELARAAAPDAALYRRALDRLDAFLAEALQAQLRTAQPVIAALESAERRELLEQHLSQRLAGQMAPVRTTPGIRRFVTATWARVLAESMQRSGEHSEVTRGYVKLVDDLIWSVQLPDHPQSRQRLLTLLPSLLERLRSGMALIALAPVEQDRVLDELMVVHTEALRPGGRSGFGALSSEEIVQRLRSEAIAPTTGAMTFSDSVIDLGSMQTVPAALMSAEPSKHVSGASRRVDFLQVSDHLRLFLHGRWARVQLLWHSDAALFYLFAGESAGRTHSITQRALERLAAEGLMQPLEARTLVQRALDAVMRGLARPH